MTPRHGGISRKVSERAVDQRMPGIIVLFRAVSHAEFSDLATCGVLRPARNSYATGKFFAESGLDALLWGTVLEGAGNFRILEVEFPAMVANSFMRFGRLDAIGPTRFGGFEELGQPKITLWRGSP